MSFNKSPLLLALAAGLFLSVQTAQAQSRQRWSIGPRVGVNYSTLTGRSELSLSQGTTSKPRYIPGLSAGVGAIYSDVSRFGLAIDVLYSQRGYGYDFRPFVSSSATTFEATDRVHYIELPVTARYFLTRSGAFRPNIFVGPVFSARLGARERITFASGNEVTTNHAGDYRPGELGVTAGFQLNFLAGNRQRFTIDGRYTYGITDATTYVTGVHNQFFTLGLGYNFGIGREYQPGDPKLTVPN